MLDFFRALSITFLLCGDGVREDLEGDVAAASTTWFMKSAGTVEEPSLEDEDFGVAIAVESTLVSSSVEGFASSLHWRDTMNEMDLFCIDSLDATTDVLLLA